MADETDKDDGVPSQIPLLEDIVEYKRVRKPRRKKQRDNYSLDLDPEPPRTRDLFDSPDTDDPPQDDADPAPFIDDEVEPELSGTELDDIDETALDEALAEFQVDEPAPEQERSVPEVDFETDETPAAAPTGDFAPDENAAPDKEARLRARADSVVDDLVREYSREIIERLRQELTTLLDELNRDDEDQR